MYCRFLCVQFLPHPLPPFYTDTPHPSTPKLYSTHLYHTIQPTPIFYTYSHQYYMHIHLYYTPHPPTHLYYTSHPPTHLYYTHHPHTYIIHTTTPILYIHPLNTPILYTPPTHTPIVYTYAHPY